MNQSTGYLTVDICNAFARRFKKVTLLAGKLKEGSRPLSESVEVVKITPYDKSTPLKRVTTWWKAYRDIKRYLKRDNGDSHVVFFTNPPISYMGANHLGNKYMIVEYDIYPEVLRNTRCPKFIINYWGKKKKIAFDSANAVITLGESMKKQLLPYKAGDSISIVPNWADVENPEKIAEEENPFIEEMGLKGKFVVMYSGNLGQTHNVETLIKVAAQMRHEENVRFLIIGRGPRREELEREVRNLGLTNVVFHDLLPAEEMKNSFSCADLGVVSLSPRAAQSSVPSKTYNLLSYGIPILNISTPESELGSLVAHYNCGISLEKDDITGISEFIGKCVTDRKYHSFLKDSAKKASADFTFKNAERYVEIYDEALRNVF